ncbi:MAG: ABC transporter permease [Chloroflexi bacterium]|nr:ABC transporter permease [Chloroflexota bacterium]
MAALSRSTPRWSPPSRRYELASIGLGVLLWWAVARLSGLPAFILPTPGQVLARGWEALRSGLLLRHTWVTLQEVLVGLALGVLLGAPLGYALAKSRRLERIFAPYIVASQAVPVVAIAPLLIIWFGPGMLSKVLITVLISFFPLLINTLVGVRSVPEELHHLLCSLGARRWQVLRYLEIPATLPMFFSGLRIAATLSVVGAVVGEFIAAREGLGFLINAARGRYDTALVFVGVLTLMALALSLYAVVRYAESRLLFWQRRNGQSVVVGPSRG